MPCNADATHVKITESMQEDKMRDGEYYCRNRADEEAFANSSSLLLDWIDWRVLVLDLEKILIPCNTAWGHQGFKCTNV